MMRSPEKVGGKFL